MCSQILDRSIELALFAEAVGAQQTLWQSLHGHDRLLLHLCNLHDIALGTGAKSQRIPQL